MVFIAFTYVSEIQDLSVSSVLYVARRAFIVLKIPDATVPASANLHSAEGKNKVFRNDHSGRSHRQISHWPPASPGSVRAVKVKTLIFLPACWLGGPVRLYSQISLRK